MEALGIGVGVQHATNDVNYTERISWGYIDVLYVLMPS